MTNQPILGFNSLASPILTPALRPRQIHIFSPSSLTPFNIQEPHIDTNKIYSAISSLPLHSKIRLDLEDIGLSTLDILSAPKQPAPFEISSLLGGAWVLPSDPSEKISQKRLALVLVLESTQCDVFVSKGWNGHINTLFSDIHNLDGSYQWIMPVLQPDRVETERGVVFIG